MGSGRLDPENRQDLRHGPIGIPAIEPRLNRIRIPKCRRKSLKRASSPHREDYRVHHQPIVLAPSARRILLWEERFDLLPFSIGEKEFALGHGEVALG
jgi:hypothetical protein